jgi:hypothetical protein
MYNSAKIETGLGQAATTTSSPSMIDTLFANLTKGVEVGLNVYDKVRQLQDVVKARKQAQEQARIAAQVQAAQQQVLSVQPTQQVESGMGWGTIGLIGLGGVALILLLKK